MDISGLVNKVLSDLPERTGQIIAARMGFETGQPKVLEAIGKELGITRERVRQLEAAGIKQIDRTLGKSSLLDDFFKVLDSHLDHFNGVREEKRFLRELAFLVDAEDKEIPQIRFLVFLYKKLHFFPEDEDCLSFWSKDKKFAVKVVEFIKKINKSISAKKEPLAVEDFEKFVKEIAKASGFSNVGSGSLMSWISLSRAVSFSPFGYIGSERHLEIMPANVGDKAYLVLKTEEQPMHFRDLADSMNQYAKASSSFHPVWQKTVEAQTVHNELIKNSNFILVGRGIYALAEWGYKKGTVKDVIVEILKKSRKPLTLQEITAAVKKIRLVKDTTIFINLQDKAYFQKTKDRRYFLRKDS